MTGACLDTQTIQHAKRLWTYMSSMRAHGPCDAVVVCCSYDLRVCDYACELMGLNLAPRLVLSGRSGNWTRHLWTGTEAEVFRNRAISNGLDPGKIVIEDASTNFGENIAFVRRLLPDLKRVTFVTKPNSVLRVALTIPIQWPAVTAFVDAPPLVFPEGVSNVVGLFGLINEMVGDVQRIIQYPSRGFQRQHDLPQEVRESWEALLAAGFNHHLLSEGSGATGATDTLAH